ncbi:MAG: hypothetical protein ACJZ5B_01980 [Candidatus Poseidoniaceae archaeon]
MSTALDIVATMVQVGTDVSVAHPSQTIVGTGLRDTNRQLLDEPWTTRSSRWYND